LHFQVVRVKLFLKIELIFFLQIKEIFFEIKNYGERVFVIEGYGYYDENYKNNTLKRQFWKNNQSHKIYFNE